MSTLQYVREIFKERIQQFQEYRKTPGSCVQYMV
jgi:hypothetical protein